MAARSDIEKLLFYVLSEGNRQLLISRGLEGVPEQSRIAALRGLQDLGWIGHGGFAAFENSYSLTREGKRIALSQPPVESFPESVRQYIESLRELDGGTEWVKKEALKRLIASQCDHGNWDSAFVNCFQLRRIAERTKDVAALALARYYEGKVEMAQNRWDDALEANLSAVELYMEIGDRRGVSEANRTLGVVYGNRGDHASALRCFETSLEMARAINDKMLEAKAEGNRAIIYDLEGRFEDSERAHKASLRLFMELGDLTSAARTSNNLGVLCMSREMFDIAAEYFENTIETCRNVSCRSVLGIALVNAGYCCARTGQTGRAVQYTDEAVSIFKESNDQNMLALAYRNYGSVEMRSQMYDRAFEWFEKSVRTAKASGVEDTFAACCYEYGMALMKAGASPKLSKKLLARSCTIYKDLGNQQRARVIETHLHAA